MKFKDFFNTEISIPKMDKEELTPKPLEEPKKSKVVVARQNGYVSNRRSSVRPGESPIKRIGNNLSFIYPNFNFDAIPLIRKLRTHNPDVGLVINDMKELSNTGHQIKFSEEVPFTKAEQMRKHLKEVSKNWMSGTGNINGIVNKLVSQAWIGGAISIETIPNPRLNSIESIGLVNPEEIRVKLNKRTRKYEYYQTRSNNSMLNSDGKGYVRLNENQYRYFAINGDEEIPYGIPPFITALEAIETQKDMKDNIAYIMDQLGIMGFLEFLMEKPPQEADESDGAYIERLNNTLTDLRRNISKGFKEGIVVGYKEDHEANFHSTTKNIANLDSIFNLNQVQVANGLKTSPAFMGINIGSSESFMTIVFTKMLSQLKNVQSLTGEALSFIYRFELRLAGFDNKYINTLYVEFEPSTISDNLKNQQAHEIKRRNLLNDYKLGLISLETMAELLGYGKPDQKEPRVSLEKDMGEKDPMDKKKREKEKDDSDRRSRDKDKPVPKRRDTDTRNP